MTKTRLSVNVNKIALLRNSRGANYPDLLKVAKDCEAFGAEGITVHPRPDQRHIRYADVPLLRNIVTTEFNIEGNPIPSFRKLVLDNPPHQVTLVPDKPDALTSNNGWDTIGEASFLKDVIAEFKSADIRVSLFLNPEERLVEGAKEVGADRIELYTGPYAENFHSDRGKAVEAYSRCGELAVEIGLGLNAGHDLNLDNLKYFKAKVPGLQEVSIGHALFTDAIYLGLNNTIQLYLKQLI